jgi:hypothetical protein
MPGNADDGGMKSTLLLLAGLVTLASAQMSALNLGYDDQPRRSRFAAIAVETGSSLLGGALLGIGAAAVVRTQFGGDINFLEPEAIGPVVVMMAAAGAGYGLGSGIGAWAGGSLLSETGRFGGALLGSLAGTAVGLGLGLAAGQLVDPPAATFVLLVPALAAPVAGSVIGYNLSRPCTDCGITRRMTLPGLGVALTSDEAGRPVAAPRLQLVGFAI